MTRLQCVCLEWAETGCSQEEIKLKYQAGSPGQQSSDPAEGLGNGAGGDTNSAPARSFGLPHKWPQQPVLFCPMK